jgi:thiamine-monophosphate kinase
VLVPVGDDCAVVKLGGTEWAMAADMLVYGHHFLDWATPEEVGYKAVAVNVSDVAAMGGEPRFMLCSGGAADPGTTLRCMEGVIEAAKDFGVYPLGGDTTGAAALTVDVTVIGAFPAGTAPVLRSGARPGDLLAVTGELGASGAGFLALEARRRGEAERLVKRHLRPEPRMEAGRAAAMAGVRAMIDLSDGLASDVRHICEASGVGCRVDLERLPIAEDTRAFAESEGRDPEVLAATGGEDYELLVAAPGETLREMAESCEVPVSVVGEVTARKEIEFLRDGVVQGSLSGWDHFQADG